MGRTTRWAAWLSVVSLAVGCAGSASRAQRHDAARPAVTDLQAGNFEEAEGKATATIDKDGKNGEARLVRALTRYLRLSARLYDEIVVAARAHEDVDAKSLREACERAEKELAAVEEDLAAAAKDDGVALELCLACWSVDWDHDGKIDSRDTALFQMEVDGDGKPLPDGDPRRRPTFRFDLGDVYWARAMVAFQRAALDLLLGFRLEDLYRMEKGNGTNVLHIGDPSRVKAARDRILEGLDHSDRSRVEYLAEKDDDREWVPNPRQKNHPMPLPVDDALYDTWKGVVRDVRALMESEEGIDLGELATLAGIHKNAPHGFVNVGRLFSEPRDLVLDRKTLKHAEKDPDAALRSILGDALVPQMKPSPLPRRLVRMQQEIGHGDESFERKLRYLLWIN